RLGRELHVRARAAHLGVAERIGSRRLRRAPAPERRDLQEDRAADRDAERARGGFEREGSRRSDDARRGPPETGCPAAGGRPVSAVLVGEHELVLLDARAVLERALGRLLLRLLRRLRLLCLLL